MGFKSLSYNIGLRSTTATHIYTTIYFLRMFARPLFPFTNILDVKLDWTLHPDKAIHLVRAFIPTLSVKKWNYDACKSPYHSP